MEGLGQMGFIIRAIRKNVFDFFYEWNGVTRGRRFFDGSTIPTGVELWAGRSYLIVEPLFMQKLWRRVHERVTAGDVAGA